MRSYPTIKEVSVGEILLTKKVSILGRDGVITDFRSLRSVLAIVRLETVVVLEVFLPGNFLSGCLRVVVTIELGLARLEFGVGLITAREIKLEIVQK